MNHDTNYTFHTQDITTAGIAHSYNFLGACLTQNGDLRKKTWHSINAHSIG